MDINVPSPNQDDRVGWGAFGQRGCVAALSEARIAVIFVVDADSDVTESLASRRRAPVLGGNDQLIAVLQFAVQRSTSQVSRVQVDTELVADVATHDV